MAYNDPVRALEEVNAKYLSLLHSEEYRKGCRRLSEFTPPVIIRKVKEYLVGRKIEKHLWSNHDKTYWAEGTPCREPVKGVVYTCITGGYDRLKEPVLVGRNLDYICISDQAQTVPAGSAWRFRSIPAEIQALAGNKVNRYCKMHPFTLFPEYDYAVYIDGNVTTVSDISYLYEIARASKTGIAMHRHSRRNCSYEEAEACILYHRGNIENMKKMLKKYQEDGFPRKFGLLEATIIVVDLHNSNAKEIYERWWDDLNENGTGRDQLSLPEVLWRLHYTIEDVGDLGNNEYENPKFLIASHS